MRRITTNRELLVAAKMFHQNTLKRMVFTVTSIDEVPDYPGVLAAEDDDMEGPKAVDGVLTQKKT